VNKYSLDISPGMLEVQKRNNPCTKLLNEDICTISLRNKEIDIALMIDVIEHIPNPKRALKELKRISNFVIFKVPLEDSLILKTYNFIKKGKPRQNLIESIGHINVYNKIDIIALIELNGGSILEIKFTNCFEYFLKNEYYAKQMNNKNKLINHIASHLFKVSPHICSCLFSDFLMILVKYN
jgi:SAM-dependent methyltransferase